MNASPLTGTTVRPLGKYAALFDSPPTQPPPPRWTPQFGFGSRYANKAYTPPAPKPLPADYLRTPKGS